MNASASQDTRDATQPVVVDLLEERTSVAKRVVEGQTIRVVTTTHLHDQVVEERLAREIVEVERVPIGRVVEAAPAIREEGDCIIVPVLEEVLVVERRLVLKEEVRLRRVRTTEVHRETVQLRQQEATVTRSDTVGGPVELPPQPHTQQRETP